MESLLHLDRAFRALITASAFWFVAALVLTDERSGLATRKARTLQFLIDIVLVGPLGRTGAAALLAVLGMLAAVAILRAQDTA